MAYKGRVLLLFSTVAVALCGNSALAQQITPDIVIHNTRPVRTMTDTELLKSRAHTNPLPPPQESEVRMQEGPEPGIPGAIGADTSSARAFGSFGIPYTSKRVQLGSSSVPNTDGNFLSTTYPYRVIGRLNFSAGGSSSFCSASVIKRGIIVTAAHCVQNFGGGNTLYSNFQFRPGHWGSSGATATQIAPYGTWNWLSLVRPASWANGTDIGSGAARDNDLAVIALAKDSRGRFIGDIVGYLGYGWNNYSFVSSSKTGDLKVAATSTLGYPALMDGGRIMQRADGPSYLTTVSGAGQIWQGSNFTGGASGGPWIVNYGAVNPTLSGGAVQGTASLMSVIGVTSWGSSDPNAPKDNYSSQFRQNTRYPNASYGTYGAGNIGSLLNTLCSFTPSGSTSTLAQQGFCN
jgi:hypothetical protein